MPLQGRHKRRGRLSEPVGTVAPSELSPRLRQTVATVAADCRHGCRTRDRRRHGGGTVGGMVETGRGERLPRRRDRSEPVTVGGLCSCMRMHGGTDGERLPRRNGCGRLSPRLPRRRDRRQTIRTRDRCHGAQERHRARRGIGTGANPSAARERHGGRFWRVWRHGGGTVGRLSEPEPNHGERLRPNWERLRRGRLSEPVTRPNP